jgi:membrane protease YdiL (CAAX protease family)
VPILATTFLLCEEIGFRGYLLPKLLPLGRKRALLLSGLVSPPGTCRWRF